MDQAEYEQMAVALRAAIAHRRSLRPGTPAHWRAECEARALMKRLVAAAPLVGQAVMQPPGLVDGHAPGAEGG